MTKQFDGKNEIEEKKLSFLRKLNHVILPKRITKKPRILRKKKKSLEF